ncbi:MAG: transglutaminase family protein [Actinomycetota bacterium]|nr:transglutaminase family protein [Actinomycetota bacterium]
MSAGCVPSEVSGVLGLEDVGIAALDLVDPKALDWTTVARTAYLLHQRLRYEYPTSIRDLAHRLMVIPPKWHGNQRRVLHRLDVSGAPAHRTDRVDGFGNHVVDVRAARVAKAVEFEAWVVVERSTGAGATLLPGSALGDRRLLDPSPLTAPDPELRRVAASLARGGTAGLELALAINEWVHGAMRYRHGFTDVRTTAAAALATGRGVCQDYAHVMLALCRLCGLPARYVSGHMLGEGGTHAWVEVVVPASGRPGLAEAVALDPTHGRLAGLTYLTVAVGRDYTDVAPTSGSFRASCSGRLSAHKQVGVTGVEFALAS